MKNLLLVLLITSGCSIAPRARVTRQDRIISCTHSFLQRSVAARAGYSICRNLFKLEE
jgi:hypothetical protein